MGTHAGALYLGTHNWEPNDWATNGGGAPLRGGFQVWGTTDGDTWTKVIDQGHGNVSSTGLRTILSTPAGAFFGTSNHASLVRLQARLHSGLTDIPDMDEGFEVYRGV